MKGLTHSRIELKTELECAAIEIKSRQKQIVICCFYNPPENSPYRASPDNIKDVLKQLHDSLSDNSSQLILTGDINLAEANWDSLNSNDEYEANILDTLEKFDLHQLITCHEGRSLDVFLATDPTLVLSSAIDSALEAQYSSNGKKCSDHHAYKTYLSLPTSSKITTPAIKRAYQKTDWDDFNKQIVSQSFTPYCYSNIDVLLLQWYKWLENIIDEKIPRVTKHRAEIPPWIRSSTSHQMKIVATMKRKYAKANSLSLLLNIKKA